MLASIVNGWSYYENVDQSDDVLDIPFQVNCSAAVCTWVPVYYTLSVRSQCNPMNWDDVDKSIVSLPRGTSFNMVARNSVPESSVKHFDPGRPPLLYILAAGEVEHNTTFQAVECLMYWTVDEFSNGKLDWSGLHEYRKETQTQTLTQSHGGDKDVVMVLESSNCSDSGKNKCPGRFTVTMEANNGLQNTLRGIFVGNLTTKRDSINKSLYYDPDDQYTELLGRTWRAFKNPLHKVIEFYVQNVAISIRNNIRSRSNTTEWVRGRRQFHTPYFFANRMYLLYPGCLLGLSVFFVLTTILWT